MRTRVLDSHRGTSYKVKGRIRKTQFQKRTSAVDTRREEADCAAHDWGGDSQEEHKILKERSQEYRPSKGKEKGRKDEDKITGRVP